MAKLLQYFQEKVVFLPVALPLEHEFKFETAFEEYLWETPFDGKINGLHFKIENPKGVILYFHGNADNLHRWGKIAAEFTHFGYDVLVMDLCKNFIKRIFSSEECHSSSVRNKGINLPVTKFEDTLHNILFYFFDFTFLCTFFND